MVTESTRAKAAERLDGMDVYDMLNLQGDGYIHQVVLARTLHIFDQSVFSQAAVQEIIDILATVVPDQTDGRVPLQAFVDYVAGRLLLPTLTARSGSTKSGEKTPTQEREFLGNSVDAYENSLVADIKGFHEVVKPEEMVDAAGTSPEEIAQLRTELKAAARQYVIGAQRVNIGPLGDEFDKGGVLDPTDCTALVAAYLHAMAGKASEIIRGSIELGIELSLIISLKNVKNEETRAQMKQHAELQVEAIHKNVAPLVQQLLEKMAVEDPHTIAGELLASLDYNADGMVTRDEFETRFVESMQYVLGPEGLMDKLQAKNKLR